MTAQGCEAPFSRKSEKSLLFSFRKTRDMLQQIPELNLAAMHQQNRDLRRRTARFRRKRDPSQNRQIYLDYVDKGIKEISKQHPKLAFAKPVNSIAGKFYLTLPLATFRRVVEEIVVLQLDCEHIKMRFLASLILQAACEDYLVDTFYLGKLCMEHRNRKTLKVDDFRLVRKIKGEFERSNLARSIAAAVAKRLHPGNFNRRIHGRPLRRGRRPTGSQFLPPILRPARAA